MTASDDQTECAIEVHELTRRFNGATAVDRLTVRIPAGEIFGLLGANGAGKSTTIKMLTTLLSPTSGTASVAGFDIVKAAHQVRRRIGYVPQMLSADGALTGYENLMLSARLYNVPADVRIARIDEALNFMGLTDSARKLVKTYSGGMVRRLELAQSMLHRPAVLFLDEPTIGLDPAARHTVWDRLRDLNETYRMSILLTTHDMDEADHLCHEVAILHGGKLIVRGTPGELKAGISQDASMDDVFLQYSGAKDSAGRLQDVAETRRVAQRLG